MRMRAAASFAFRDKIPMPGWIVRIGCQLEGGTRIQSSRETFPPKSEAKNRVDTRKREEGEGGADPASR